jgi:hypothetical protein
MTARKRDERTRPCREKFGRRHGGWTREQVEALRDLWGKVRAPAIGELIGKTRNAVIGKAYRLGLPTVSAEKLGEWVSSGLNRHHERRHYREALPRLIVMNVGD